MVKRREIPQWCAACVPLAGSGCTITWARNYWVIGRARERESAQEREWGNPAHAPTAMLFMPRPLLLLLLTCASDWLRYPDIAAVAFLLKKHQKFAGKHGSETCLSRLLSGPDNTEIQVTNSIKWNRSLDIVSFQGRQCALGTFLASAMLLELVQWKRLLLSQNTNYGGIFNCVSTTLPVEWFGTNKNYPQNWSTGISQSAEC